MSRDPSRSPYNETANSFFVANNGAGVYYHSACCMCRYTNCLSRNHTPRFLLHKITTVKYTPTLYTRRWCTTIRAVITSIYCDVMTSPYTKCDYLGLKGVCNRSCFGGRCSLHRKSTSMHQCLEGCGRGTASVTQYCHGCGNSQFIALRRRKKDSITMGALVDDILSWDWSISPREPPF